MAYSKTNWVNENEPAINADNLNKIEAGIEDNSLQLESYGRTINEIINNKLDVVDVLNEASTDTDKTYSADYLNDKLVSVGTEEPTDDIKVWFKTIDNSIVVDNQEWFNPNNVEKYSTNETKIGTWIDGKPIYRKTFNVTSVTNTNSDLVDISGLNVDNMVKLYGIINGTYLSMPMPLTDSSQNYNVILKSGTKIRGRVSWGSGTFVSCYITIEYTKTTD